MTRDVKIGLMLPDIKIEILYGLKVGIYGFKVSCSPLKYAKYMQCLVLCYFEVCKWAKSSFSENAFKFVLNYQ